MGRSQADRLRRAHLNLGSPALVDLVLANLGTLNDFQISVLQRLADGGQSQRSQGGQPGGSLHSDVVIVVPQLMNQGQHEVAVGVGWGSVVKELHETSAVEAAPPRLPSLAGFPPGVGRVTAGRTRGGQIARQLAKDFFHLARFRRGQST